jgi:protein archease
MQTRFGFREHAHTADWELEVWATNLPELLEQAARGMYAISGTRMNTDSPQYRSLTLQAADAESLLVRFLGELLWLEQEQRMAFDEFSINVDSNFHLQAELRGGRMISLDKEIKAVTYHKLAVRTTKQGLRVNIVFDV